MHAGGIHKLYADDYPEAHRLMKECKLHREVNRQQPFKAWMCGNPEFPPTTTIPGMKAAATMLLGQCSLALPSDTIDAFSAFRETIAQEIEAELADFHASDLGVREATEALALHSLDTRGFSPSRFWQLMQASGLDFDALYAAYVGKNVLNFFRQDHGYKSGTYTKIWGGREDNEHLVEVLEGLSCDPDEVPEAVYAALQARYPTT